MTEEEVRKAVGKLKNGKSAGLDQIQPELLKCAGAEIPALTKLFNDILTSKIIPSCWKHGIIIPLPNKRDHTESNNWHGITLLSVPGKIFAVMMNFTDFKKAF